MSLATATADVLAVFTAAGLRAVDDARDINPPCVFLMPPTGSLRFERGRAEVEWAAYLIVGNAGARPATKALSELIDKIAGQLPITTFELAPLALPGGGDPMPSYRLSWKSIVTIGAATP
jgi:hypothetical protein